MNAVSMTRRRLFGLGAGLASLPILGRIFSRAAAPSSVAEISARLGAVGRPEYIFCDQSVYSMIEDELRQQVWVAGRWRARFELETAQARAFIEGNGG